MNTVITLGFFFIESSFKNKMLFNISTVKLYNKDLMSTCYKLFIRKAGTLNCID